VIGVLVGKGACRMVQGRTRGGAEDPAETPQVTTERGKGRGRKSMLHSSTSPNVSRKKIRRNRGRSDKRDAVDEKSILVIIAKRCGEKF